MFSKDVDVSKRNTSMEIEKQKTDDAQNVR